jgi:hypothetical protein
MSFRDLVSGGAECGPSNPLATFGKQFGQDRGAQLDRFGQSAEASGSSRLLVSTIDEDNRSTRRFEDIVTDFVLSSFQ